MKVGGEGRGGGRERAIRRVVAHSCDNWNGTVIRRMLSRGCV